MKLLCKLFIITVIVLTTSIHMCPGHGRGRTRRHYRNTLMRMHYHSWSLADLIEGLLVYLQGQIFYQKRSFSENILAQFCIFDETGQGLQCKKASSITKYKTIVSNGHKISFHLCKIFAYKYLRLIDMALIFFW